MNEWARAWEYALTLAHEQGHALDEHGRHPLQARLSGRRGRYRQELAAVSMIFLVVRRLGLDDRLALVRCCLQQEPDRPCESVPLKAASTGETAFCLGGCVHLADPMLADCYNPRGGDQSPSETKSAADVIWRPTLQCCGAGPRVAPLTKGAARFCHPLDGGHVRLVRPRSRPSVGSATPCTLTFPSWRRCHDYKGGTRRGAEPVADLRGQ